VQLPCQRLFAGQEGRNCRWADVPSSTRRQLIVTSFGEGVLVNGPIDELAGDFEGHENMQQNPQDRRWVVGARSSPVGAQRGLISG